MSSVSPFSVEANGSKAGSPSKPNREKALIAGIIVLAIVIVGLIIAVIILAVKASKEPTSDVCTTAACLETALDLKRSMNDSADPCEDFYKFACGRWGISHPGGGQSALGLIAIISAFRIHALLTAAQSDESLPSNVVKIAGAYAKCGVYTDISEEDGDWLENALNGIGGWPMVDISWNENSYHWEPNLAAAIRNFTTNGIIAIDVGEDIFDTSKRVIQIAQPVMETMPKLQKERILNVAKKLSIRDEKEMEKEYEEVEKFAEHLKQMSRRIMDLIEDRTQTKGVSFKQLKEDFRWVNWQEFLHTALGPSIGYSISDKDTILVAGSDYLSNVLESLFEGSIKKRTLANYIAVSIIQHLLESNAAIGLTNPEFMTPTDPLGKSLKRFTVPQGFSSGCYSFFTQRASPAVDFLNYKNRDAATVDPKMLTYFSSAMNDQISEANWLGDTTKQRALEKLHEMKYFIAFPERIKDPNKVQKYFEGLPELSTNVLQNQVLIESHAFNKKVELLRVPTDKSKWPMTDGVQASQTNAMYVQDSNAVAMPADIQLKPVFAAERPKYWNFGAFGWIIGHEITHGFDTSGSKRDKDGNMKNWWMPEAKKQFSERAKCLIEQYNKIPYGYENHYVNGTQTVGENVADNGGMRQAYAAYKKWEKDHEKEKTLPGFEKYSIEQLFFIAMAQGYCSGEIAPKEAYEQFQHDEHSPTHMRFNPAASNFDAFAKAFKCKKGSPMNPAKKCVVW